MKKSKYLVGAKTPSGVQLADLIWKHSYGAPSAAKLAVFVDLTERSWA